MIKNVSSNWASIVDRILIDSSNLKDYVLGENITWSSTPQFPNCQLFDLTKYWNLENRTIYSVRFFFYKKANVSVSLHVEDKRRALEKRTLKSQTTDEEGSQMLIQNLNLEDKKRYYLSISQIRNLEMDPGVSCQNYPTDKFFSYQECDELFVHNLMKNHYKIMPFWAARKLDEVLESRYYMFFGLQQEPKESRCHVSIHDIP